MSGSLFDMIALVVSAYHKLIGASRFQFLGWAVILRFRYDLYITERKNTRMEPSSSLALSNGSQRDGVSMSLRADTTKREGLASAWFVVSLFWMLRRRESVRVCHLSAKYLQIRNSSISRLDTNAGKWILLCNWKYQIQPFLEPQEGEDLGSTSLRGLRRGNKATGHRQAALVSSVATLQVCQGQQEETYSD